jgi:PST family polysaccharide transporter
MKETIKTRAVQGVMWVGLIQLLRSGIQFVITIILARLLFPKDFGTIGMALIFINLVSELNSLGFSAALVQRKDLTEDHLSTAFWSNLMVGILLYGVVAGSSPFVAAFFGNPQVQPIMMAISLSMIISPIGMVHSTLLTRKLDFGRNGLFQIGGTFIEGTVSIWMALNGFGVWSLVWGALVSSTLTSISKWFIVDWRPSLRFRVTCFKDLFSFGIYTTGLNLINSGALNVDYFFVGKIMGAGPLGVYTVAFNLATLSCRKITMLVGKVAFPAFSRIQDDDAMMRRMYLKSVSYVSLIAFPVTAGLFVVAPDLIQVVYTSKWGAALLPLKILCVVGLLKSVEVSVFAVYQAKGRADLDFKFQCVYLAVLALGVWLGIGKGIIGVATAVAIVEILFTIMRQYVVNKLIGLRFSSFWSSLAPATVGCIVMIMVLEAYIHLLRGAVPEHEAFRLFSSIPIGAAVYLATLWIHQREIIDEIVGLAREQNILNRRSWREKWQRPAMQPKIEMEEKVSGRKGVKK